MLEALGIDFELRPGDVAARGNFCTVDAAGRITDRRAGRISTELCVALSERLRGIRLDGVEAIVEPVKEHRFVLVLRGPGLSGRLTETDPQVTGQPPLPIVATAPEAERTAALVNRFVEAARPLLADARPANMILLRGFDQRPDMPRFPEIFGVKAAAIAAYPMYRGLARLVGMEVLKTGSTFADEVATLREHWSGYDFFFLHYKDTDKAGEDGDFDAKVAALERLGRAPARDPRAPARRSRRLGRSRHARGARRARLAARARASRERVLRQRPRHPLHRARLRGGQPRPRPRAPPDAAGDGQRATLHQVRRVGTRRGRGLRGCRAPGRPVSSE